MDVQIGRLRSILDTNQVADNTIIFYTADNGPHQGAERTDIHWSTAFLRQCKASIFEGGIRVPGIMYWPQGISSFKNISTPVGAWDVLPTVMELLQVETDNPTWAMDGTSLIPIINNPDPAAPRVKPMVFKWGGQSAVIDNEMKLAKGLGAGVCCNPLSSLPTCRAPGTASV